MVYSDHFFAICHRADWSLWTTIQSECAVHDGSMQEDKLMDAHID